MSTTEEWRISVIDGAGSAGMLGDGRAFARYPHPSTRGLSDAPRGHGPSVGGGRRCRARRILRAGDPAGRTRRAELRGAPSPRRAHAVTRGQLMLGSIRRLPARLLLALSVVAGLAAPALPAHAQ